MVKNYVKHGKKISITHTNTAQYSPLTYKLINL